MAETCIDTDVRKIKEIAVNLRQSDDFTGIVEKDRDSQLQIDGIERPVKYCGCGCGSKMPSGKRCDAVFLNDLHRVRYHLNKKTARKTRRRKHEREQVNLCPYVSGLIELALEKWRKGIRRYGIDTLIGEYRWTYGVSINNNLKPHLARIIMAREPRLEGFFETRGE